MKNIILLFLLATGYCFAQTNIKTDFDAFKAQLEAYQSNPATANIKPADCKKYKLVYTVTGADFTEIATPKNQSGLCDDLKRYDVSRHNAPPGDSYDIKAIGDQYYSIRVDHNHGGQVSQTWYYYQRHK
jgi:hypothetical protein